MDTALQDPASTSVCSDDDAYNTENARIHFGPLRSPERKFAAMEENLAQTLASDTVPPPNHVPVVAENDPAVDEDNDTDDNEDASRVEELVGSADDDEGNGQDDEIPFSADYVDDEPSSALALRISCASSNPSPPPSPSRPSTNLEPVEPTTTEGSPPAGDTTYPAEEAEPEVIDIVQPLPDVPPVSQSPSPSPPKEDRDMEVDTVLPATPPPQPDLINFDSFTPLRIPSEFVASGNIAPDSAVSAVDALLLRSPSVEPITPTTNPVVLVPSNSGPNQGEPEATIANGVEKTDSILVVVSSEATNSDPAGQMGFLTPPPPSPPTQQLRRSPRKSVAQVTSALSTPQAPVTPRRSISRSPKKKKPKVDEAVEESQDESDVPMDNNTLLPVQQTLVDATPQEKERSRSKSPLRFGREVGSLSPGTSNLLSELIPSFTDRTPLELAAEPVGEPSGSVSEPIVTVQGMQTFSVFSAPPAEPLPSTPKRSTSSIRPLGTPSPSKFRLQVSAPQNVPETPARRITIEQALETGQISPLKASQLGFTPGAKSASSNPALPQTPARRVLITDKGAPGPSSAVKRAPAPPSAVKQAPRPGSTPRQEPRAHAPLASSVNASRQASGVPSFARPTAVSSALGSHSVASSSSNGVKTSKLPFPIVATEKLSSSSASTLKEQGDKGAPSFSSPGKSSLKQPTSRIPRIGAKPYARPTAASKTAAPRQAPVPAPPAAPAVPKPVVIRKVDLSRPSTTKMVNKVAPRVGPSTSTTTMVNGTGKETNSLRTVVPASSSSNAASSSIVATSSSIKRKRSPDSKPAPASPVKSRMPPRAAKTAAVAAVAAASKPIPLSSLTRPAPVPQLKQPRTIRKVVDPAPPAPAPPPPPPPAIVAFESQIRTPPTEQPQAEPTLLPKPPSPLLTAPPPVHTPPLLMQPVPELDVLGSPMKEDSLPPVDGQPPQPQPAPKSRRASLIPLPTPVVLPTIQIDPPNEHPPIETLPPQEIPAPSGVRRTTRQRKSVDPAAEPAPRATSSRRKVSQGPRLIFTDAYSEMSVTALKQLTSANTMRNQHYLSARLELEVVKRDGLRPESPMVKIKTVAQREAEEQSMKRSERAERRARRSGESMPGSSDLEMDSDDEGKDGELPQLEQPEAHVRGAGEDEDYKTPDRAFRRMKLTEDGMQDVEMNERKRVKWDRGLFTVVYMDEVQLGSRQVGKENKPGKGCLAPTAKALRLDTLGNLGGSDDPLPELIPQHVMVKKFVYDGEVIEPLITVPPPPPPVPKVTRSRSRKSKS